MANKRSRYQPPPKAAARSNPIVLGARAASWMFWVMVAIFAALIIGSTYWLLTHSITT